MRGARRSTFLLATAALICFAGNSLLCRAALARDHVDAATFTALRLGAGALILSLLLRTGVRDGLRPRGPWALRSLALFAYAALFSWAYVRVVASVGALVLFACVQLTMLGWAMRRGEGPTRRQGAGALLALGGLAVLAAPGLTRPDPLGILLMALSGVAWGAYSLLGRGVTSPTATTGAAFVGAALPALAVLGVAATGAPLHVDTTGALCAVLSGAVTSALGYVAWYAVVPQLGAARAGVLQLAVPVLTAVAGVLLLSDEVTLRLVSACAAILAGVALAVSATREL